jgi:TonB family protein
MFRHVLLSLVVVAMFTQSLCAISREELSREALIGRYKDWKKFAIYTPAPQYPAEAAARHIRGSGIFIICVHVKTGLVVSAWASQSIGSPLLDSAAIRALSQWRFKPGMLTPIGVVAPQLHEPFGKEDALLKVPITFAF